VLARCYRVQVERAELLELLSADGLRLLDNLPEWREADDIVKVVADLRAAGHPAGLVATVLSQAKLRAKAAVKFGEFAAHMLFTTAGLEQATRLSVAALHAGRFAQAGLTRVADLGCGIGGDALALSSLDREVTAVEADEVTAAIASYNLAPFPRATVLHARAEDVTLDVDGIWFDPARRHTVAGTTTRLHDPQAYCPPLSFVWDLAAHTPLGVKLGPGTDRSVIPPHSEAQWVSVDGNLVELAVWCGSLARSGVRRAALVIRGNSHHELTGESDAADVPVGPLGEYLYEPDGAVIRARQIGALARTHAATMISDGIAYLTSDRQFHSPFVRGFRVLEQLPGDERHLRQALAARRIGVLDIKKRGVGIDPAALRKRLRLKGDASATVVMTRVGGRHLTLLVERITEPQ